VASRKRRGPNGTRSNLQNSSAISLHAEGGEDATSGESSPQRRHVWRLRDTHPVTARSSR
jgi:hypothetical protein